MIQEMLNSSNIKFRKKLFKGAKIEDELKFISTLAIQHQKYFEKYKKENNIELYEYHRGMQSMAITIYSHMKAHFNYQIAPVQGTSSEEEV